jgi:hypothetical protein
VTTGVRSGWIGDGSKKLYRHTVEMEQMMTHLWAKIRTNRGHLKGEIRARQEHRKKKYELAKKP